MGDYQLYWKNKMKTPIRERTFVLITLPQQSTNFLCPLHYLVSPNCLSLEGRFKRRWLIKSQRAPSFSASLQLRLAKPQKVSSTWLFPRSAVEVFEAAVPPGQRAAVLHELSGGDHTRIKAS